MGTQVLTEILSSDLFQCSEVLIVTGGSMSRIGSDPISSTEVRAGSAPSWTTVAPLPLALSGLRGVTIDNSFYVTGAAGSLHVECIFIAALLK